MSERAITEAWEAGKAAWPDVELAREDFAAHLETVDPTAVSQFPADLYLAAACIVRDPAALNIFDKEVLVSARYVRRGPTGPGWRSNSRGTSRQASGGRTG